MTSRTSIRTLALLAVVLTAVMSPGCQDVGGVGIGAGYPHGGTGPTTPMGVGTVWVGSPAWN